MEPRDTRKNAQEIPEPTTGQTKFAAKQRRRTGQSLRVGLFFVAALILTLLLVFVLGDRRNLFGSTFKLMAYFESVEALKSGAAVYIKGIRIGSVDGIHLMADSVVKVRVEMTIDENYRPMIRTTSVAAVGQIGLVGDKHIEIVTPDINDPIVADGSIIVGAAPVNYFAILDQAKEATKNATNITASLDTLFLRFRRGEGTLGKLLTDDALYADLMNVSSSAEELFSETSQQFSALSGTLRSTADNVDAITFETNRLLRDLGEGKGTFGALLYDRALYDSLESLVGTLNLTAGNASMAAREFGINMRGLRQNWLVGGLFSGGDADGNSADMLRKELEIQREELRKREQLLDQRERELLTGNGKPE